MAFLQQSKKHSDNNNKYSCESVPKTLEWINAIVDFIRPYSFLTNANVVNFFEDKLWESLDPQWIACLRREPVQNLLLIPSGAVQDHWPVSLKEFIETLRSLIFPRGQADLLEVFPGLNMKSLSSVLVQGMNLKKKHEVEVLAAIVSSVANSVEAQTIVDVGAGQGYLAQVLSFEYQHSVIAIDACSHHGRVTEARAERIKRHYSAQIRKYNSGCGIPNAPKAVTCRIMSAKILKALTKMTFNVDDVNQSEMTEEVQHDQTSVVLAGLHACGDLSVTMLSLGCAVTSLTPQVSQIFNDWKTFLECKEVKAVISIGCCYNLLSEACHDTAASACGFPMSNGIKSAGISIGRNSRDLACQSAERWRSLEKGAGLHNFELHAFRAAFQLLLSRYYPEIMVTSPSIGRQGKALRRKQLRKNLVVPLHHEESKCSPLPHKVFELNLSPPALQPGVPNEASGSVLGIDNTSHQMSCNGNAGCEGAAAVDKYSLFKKFCESGFSRLALNPLEEILVQETWKEAEPFAEFIGPYWSLRAALGPLLETLLLLDRLLFLQEQDDQLETVMLPIFDPVLSPRNVAIIAKRS